MHLFYFDESLHQVWDTAWSWRVSNHSSSITETVAEGRAHPLTLGTLCTAFTPESQFMWKKLSFLSTLNTNTLANPLSSGIKCVCTSLMATQYFRDLLLQRESKGIPEEHLLLLHWLKPLTVDHNELWKILKEVRRPDHFTCLLRNLYAGQEVTEPDMEQWTDWKLGKEYVKAVYCHPAHAEYIIQNARLDEAQAGIKIARRNISNLRYANDTTLMSEKKEKLKSLLMKVKEEPDKADLKFNIQKTKIMAFSPNTSWQTDGEKMETVTDFIFLGLQNHCGWWLQPWN